MKEQCPICHENGRLIKHHWWEDNTRMVGHIRQICNGCNSILRTMNDKDNHVLPEWNKQIEYARRFRGRVIYQMRVRPATKEALLYKMACNSEMTWDNLLEPVLNWANEPPIITPTIYYPQGDQLEDEKAIENPPICTESGQKEEPAP